MLVTIENDDKWMSEYSYSLQSPKNGWTRDGTKNIGEGQCHDETNEWVGWFHIDWTLTDGLICVTYELEIEKWISKFKSMWIIK